MEWLKKQASTATAALESTLKEARVAEHLAPVTQAAGESASLLKSLGTSLETSFNQVSGEGEANAAHSASSAAASASSADHPVGPPWMTSIAGLKAFENDIKSGILRITEGDNEAAVNSKLLEAPSDEAFKFDWLEPRSTARAMAALEADPELASARKRLVPSKIKEDQFWRNYFFKVETVMNSYTRMLDKNKGGSSKGKGGVGGGVVEPEVDEDGEGVGDNDYETVEFASEGTVEQRVQASEASGLSWEEEMARELEGVQDSTTSGGGSGAEVGAGGAGAGDGDGGGVGGGDDSDDLDDFEKELGGIQ